MALIKNNCFEVHGFFPDLRPFEDLPKDIQAARKTKTGEELEEAKAKYAAIKSDSDRAYAVLVDLGLLEDYEKLGDYDDNFDDNAK